MSSTSDRTALTGAGVPLEAPGTGGAATGRLRLRSASPSIVIAAIWLVLVAIAIIVPGLLSGRDPVNDLDANAILTGPSADHWFGTDTLGRDVYSRVVHGARLSLLAGLLATGIAAGGGTLIGVLAGLRRGAVDSVLMRTMDVLIALPGLLLSMAIVSILGFGVVNVAVAVGISGIPSFARLTRSQTLRLREAGFVEVARTSGIGTAGIIGRHVLPGIAGPLVVMIALDVGGAVLSVSALSFLGFGAVPPTPEWGSMISDGRTQIMTAWWLSTFPGLAIALTVLALNRLSRALRVG